MKAQTSVKPASPLHVAFSRAYDKVRATDNLSHYDIALNVVRWRRQHRKIVTPTAEELIWDTYHRNQRAFRSGRLVNVAEAMPV